jgi:hypothetical protein
VSPKIAGIESNANARSVRAMAMMRTSKGVAYLRPLMRVVRRAPSPAGATGMIRRAARRSALSVAAPGSGRRLKAILAAV